MQQAVNNAVSGVMSRRILGAAFALTLVFLFLSHDERAEGSSTVSVCVNSKLGVVTAAIKNRCATGSKKYVPASTPTNIFICEKLITKQLFVAKTARCQSGTRRVSIPSSTGTLAICSNSKTRSVIRTTKKCVKGTTAQKWIIVSWGTTTTVPAGVVNIPPGTTDPSTTTSTSTTTTTTTVPTGTTTTTSSTTTTTTTTVPTGTTTTTSSTTTTTVAPTPTASISSFSAASTTINYGDSTTLTAVFSDGVGAINNSIGAVTTGSSITVTPTVTTTYQLHVAGAQYGDNQFASVTVNVNRLSLYRTPTSTAIETDGSTVLVSRAFGYGQTTVSFKWYKDSILIGSAVDSELLVSTPGEYVVQAIGTLNGVTKTMTSPAAVVVVNDVSISSQPTDQVVTTMWGNIGVARLSVSASGSSTPTYQWYCGNGNPIAGETYSQIFVANGGCGDSYFVDVTSTVNGIANTIRSNFVRIIQNTIFARSIPTQWYLHTGQSIDLYISAYGLNGSTISYQWFRDNTSISGATDFLYSPTIGGTYKVLVTSELGGTYSYISSADIVVTQYDDPAINELVLARTSVGRGRSTTLTPYFSGGTGVITPGNISVTSGTPITLTPAATTTYTLTVTNVVNTVATKSVELVVADGWSQTTTGSMNCPHYKPAILKMPNGKVLVTGNQYALSKCIEIFDPATKAFTRINDMALARKNPFLFNMSDGRVLILGGVQQKYPPSTTVYSIQPEIFDPADNSFTVLNTFHNGFSNQEWMPHVTHAVQMSDGRIFILSGSTGSAILDPMTGHVVQSASTLYPRTNGAITPLSDGRILLVGGNVSPTSAEVFTPVGTSRGYNTYLRQSGDLSGTSTLLESGLTARRDQFVTTSVLSDGRIMFTGGRNVNNEMQSSVDIFNPITMQFMSNPPSMSISRSSHNSVSFSDGTLMIFGGWTARIPSGTGTYQTKSVVMFDPTTNTFTSGYGELTTPRVDAPAVRLNDGTILIVGDDGNSGTPSGTNAWTAEIYTFEP